MTYILDKKPRMSELEAHRAGRRIVCFDFDGTLCENKFPGIGDPKQDTIDILENECERGSYIIISSCRLNERLQDPNHVPIERIRVLEWLERNNILDMVDSMVGDKPYADVYIDERAYNPSQTDFDRILKEMQL